MPISDSYEQFPIASILVSREARQRRKLDLGNLPDSIRKLGVLEPIIIEREGETVKLIAGERRLESARAVGLSTVPVRWAQSLSPIERQLIELEENIKRVDLPWQDIVNSVGKMHQLHLDEEPSWTVTETAEVCSLSQAHVSVYLSIFDNMGDERVAASGTHREAYNLILRRKDRAAGDALEELLFATRPIGEETTTVSLTEEEAINSMFIVAPETAPLATEPVLEVEIPVQHCDFLEWAPSYQGKKFSLIHCDFPYGIGLFSSNGLTSGPNRSQMGQGDGNYDDEPEVFLRLVECLATSLSRLLSVSGHVMFWLDSRPETIRWTMETFERLAPQLSWTRFPLIWLKSDNNGIAASPQFEPRHIYESCLLGSTGRRNIIRIKSDAYSAPTDRLLHPSAKPEPMLRHFMEMLVDEHTTVFDPTCGAGSALRAAESLGASRVLGLEKNPTMAQTALETLLASRAKRRASEMMRG